nr:unnamed protein product [Callosobruchus chinensis]
MPEFILHKIMIFPGWMNRQRFMRNSRILQINIKSNSNIINFIPYNLN